MGSAILTVAFERGVLVRIPAAVRAEVCRGPRFEAAVDRLLADRGIVGCDITRARVLALKALERHADVVASGRSLRLHRWYRGHLAGGRTQRGGSMDLAGAASWRSPLKRSELGRRMTLVDKSVFEKRGAHGCSDSDYAFAMTTCCERVGIIDEELSDFYWSFETPSRSVSLLAETECPFCGASAWALRHIHQLDQVPEHWRWACTGQPRPGSRRVLPLAEHVRELLTFCRRVASPLPAFDTTLFFNRADPRVQFAGGWVVERGALLSASEFAPRFDQLLVGGYSWINLSACGVFRNALIIGVELPRATHGVPAGLTSVNYSGPSLAPDGMPIWELELIMTE